MNSKRTTLLLVALLTCGVSCKPSYRSLRMQLVEKTIAHPNDGRDPVRDPAVLRAMQTVARHELVPDSARAYAYTDQALAIGSDQTISQPYVVAFMTEQLKLEAGDTVLEIGTGSGYQAAVLAEIVGAQNVFTIEIVEALATRAEADLTRLGYGSIHVKVGDGYLGWPEYAPFDAIIVTAAPPEIPEPLIEQLAVGGRLIAPVGGSRMQQLTLVIKTPEGLKTEETIPVLFVPMTGEAAR